MFQHFDTPFTAQNSAEKLSQLRAQMKAHCIDFLAVPHSNAFQSEFLNPEDERLAWLTGFTGSSGFALIGLEKAALFTDSRYDLQIKQQIDLDLYTPFNIADTQPSNWLKEHGFSQMVLGFDPFLHTSKGIQPFQACVKHYHGDLKALDQNLIDSLWHERPQPNQKAAFHHPLCYAGVSAQDKIKHLSVFLNEHSYDGILLSQAEEISWLFNLRGFDMPRTPALLAYALVTKEGHASLFYPEIKITDDLRQMYQGIIDFIDMDSFEDFIAHQPSDLKILFDDQQLNMALLKMFKATHMSMIAGSSPLQKWKSIKNDIELKNARQAHLKDGIAMVHFLKWFEDVTRKHAITEIDCVQKLEACRLEKGGLFDISFETIAGTGSNGALIHYRVSRESNKTLEHGSVFLIDSGGQYFEGTTDITRTLPIGFVTNKEIKKAYSLVLEGHLQLAQARFSEKASGAQIDCFARQALWRYGMDYNHGTGHGVGSFLGVHEGPVSLSPRETKPLEAGMIFSNEPGFYKENGFGIRLENLIVVQEAEFRPDEERAMLSFETLTLAPFNTSLIDPDYLSASSVQWLNSYHEKVFTTLAPHLDQDHQDWLQHACQRLCF